MRSLITQSAWEGIQNDLDNPELVLDMEGISPYLAGDTNNYHSYEHFITDIKYSLYHGRYIQLLIQIKIFLIVELMALILVVYIILVVTSFTLAIISE